MSVWSWRSRRLRNLYHSALVKWNLHGGDKSTRFVVPDYSHTHRVSIFVQDDSFISGRARLGALRDKSVVDADVAHFVSDVSLDHALRHVIRVESCVEPCGCIC